MKVKRPGRREDTGQTEMPKLGTEPALGLRSSPGLSIFGQPVLFGTWKPVCVVKQILKVHPLGELW